MGFVSLVNMQIAKAIKHLCRADTMLSKNVNGGISNPLNPCQGITNANMLTLEMWHWGYLCKASWLYDLHILYVTRKKTM